jgi:hypothetical protein
MTMARTPRVLLTVTTPWQAAITGSIGKAPPR